MKTYFDRTLTACPSGVFKQNLTLETYAITRGTQYTDFDSFFTAEFTEMTDFYTAIWIYDFGGHGVQLSYSYDAGNIELSFGLLD